MKIDLIILNIVIFMAFGIVFLSMMSLYNMVNRCMDDIKSMNILMRNLIGSQDSLLIFMEALQNNIDRVGHNLNQKIEKMKGDN